ncbi:hypothetical protein [Bradyrhizobium sp.]|uniref:hypothetical protein n=1 Tax=Bradyrhizobium sp. TaxID=376 RepID=UPI001ECD6996|nr:hypothetical protein [Bradyrhizobium sp.]MBV8891625.1 hypothetical protein [Acidobacteriota bacterium]MBV9978949.1 hypothetical protein [Bradyrhizobium sp.]
MPEQVFGMVMNFSFDPSLIAKARQLILHEPNLNVLKPEHEGQYSPLVVAIETELKKRDAAGLLLLPDLSALANSTIGIFSDYGGEDRSSKYLTYSFLICAWGSLGTFWNEMKKHRADSGLGEKEIEFKDFGMGLMRKALPGYLDLLNGYVPGLLFTVVVDKRILSLFGPQDRSTGEALSKRLEEKGVGKLKPEVAEKALRVVDAMAYLTALLGHEGQKILWMSDNDAICSDLDAHKRLLALFHNVLGLYIDRQFGQMGCALPFNERSTDYLDLLSAADIVAGSVGQYFTSRDDVGEQDARVKEGADKVLVWLGHGGLALKKFCIQLRLGDDGLIYFGAIEFTPKQTPDTTTFLPIHLCR